MKHQKNSFTLLRMLGFSEIYAGFRPAAGPEQSLRGEVSKVNFI